MDEIVMLQEEISELQTSLAQELASEPLDAEGADQMALQSTLTVLAERMATIRMKASGKRQLLEVQEKTSPIFLVTIKKKVIFSSVYFSKFLSVTNYHSYFSKPLILMLSDKRPERTWITHILYIPSFFWLYIHPYGYVYVYALYICMYIHVCVCINEVQILKVTLSTVNF